ncbi:hypothetical protein I302_108095 [Kwoniella bestiolae CBS 10118]|uniref:Uncharacterized protein n=1 Tax=Kwoniella bestiolae CBS 10118 TaxID=1296100 RepID=A0A1B9FWN3_9TREE|nr:hypothetical protein I302_07539 [Kwoniella bestiolae CBS 10118]OCF23185.1 hypothetical protein I302_07539 [Kwoniella bestiolae CBS 10118]
MSTFRIDKTYYTGWVKLGLSNVRTKPTNDEAAPVSNYLSGLLKDTKVSGWTAEKMPLERYYVPTLSGPLRNILTGGGSGLSKIAFSRELADEIMSKEGKEGTHTVHGRVLGVYPVGLVLSSP